MKSADRTRLTQALRAHVPNRAQGSGPAAPPAPPERARQERVVGDTKRGTRSPCLPTCLIASLALATSCTPLRYHILIDARSSQPNVVTATAIARHGCDSIKQKSGKPFVLRNCEDRPIPKASMQLGGHHYTASKGGSIQISKEQILAGLHPSGLDLCRATIEQKRAECEFTESARFAITQVHREEKERIRLAAAQEQKEEAEGQRRLAIHRNRLKLAEACRSISAAVRPDLVLNAGPNGATGRRAPSGADVLAFFEPGISIELACSSAEVAVAALPLVSRSQDGVEIPNPIEFAYVTRSELEDDNQRLVREVSAADQHRAQGDLPTARRALNRIMQRAPDHSLVQRSIAAQDRAETESLRRDIRATIDQARVLYRDGRSETAEQLIAKVEPTIPNDEAFEDIKEELLRLHVLLKSEDLWRDADAALEQGDFERYQSTLNQLSANPQQGAKVKKRLRALQEALSKIRLLEDLFNFRGFRPVIASNEDAELLSGIFDEFYLRIFTTKYPDLESEWSAAKDSDYRKAQFRKKLRREFRGELAAMQRAIRSLGVLIVMPQRKWDYDTRLGRFMYTIGMTTARNYGTDMFIPDPAMRDCAMTSPFNLVSIKGNRDVRLFEENVIDSLFLKGAFVPVFPRRIEEALADGGETTQIILYANVRRTYGVKDFIYGSTYLAKTCVEVKVSKWQLLKGDEVIYEGRR